MSSKLQLPEHQLVTDYLKLNKWEPNPPGTGGILWAKNDNRVGVPYDEYDRDTMMGIITRVARAENTDPESVAKDMKYLYFDVAHMRAVNDEKIVDAIPLESGAKILNSTRTMLRATATTATWERSQIGGNYSRRGDQVVSDALMGHTEHGSYVIPILIPLPKPFEMEEDTETGQQEMDVYRTPAEPFARRVVRTFAQSLNAVEELVVEPAREPTVDTVHELVYRGVSREFCGALARILSRTAVSEFESMIDWAKGVPASDTTPRQVNVDAGAVDLIQKTEEKLRRLKFDSNQVFSGTIVQLRHVGDDPYGEISIATLRRGKTSEISVRLRLEDYTRAWDWHRASRAVLVEGMITRLSNRSLRVEDPIRCHPIDDLFASGED